MSLLGSLSTWYFWAYYAVGLFIMGGVLSVHLLTMKMPGVGPWLIVAAAACGVTGAIIGGIQAGPHPLATGSGGVMLVRLFWASGITIGIVASGMYLWGMRERSE